MLLYFAPSGTSTIHAQKELLPQCDIVMITGTTTINHTLDSILEYSHASREV
ncbi:MAG: Rossmann-like domain-containing protein [Candidatus Methanospirareceae archaeon]